MLSERAVRRLRLGIIIATLIGIALAAAPVVEVMRWPTAPPAWGAVRKGMTPEEVGALLPPPLDVATGSYADPGARAAAMVWEEPPWRLTVSFGPDHRVSRVDARYLGPRLFASPEVTLVK